MDARAFFIGDGYGLSGRGRRILASQCLDLEAEASMPVRYSEPG